MGKDIEPPVTIDRFTEMAGNIVDSIPDKFLRGLNGGFNISEECKKDGEYFIMGEYTIDDIMGSVIMIYYGSFVELMGDKYVEEWKEELKETILHELRHHVELMAGVDYLSEEEKADL